MITVPWFFLYDAVLRHVNFRIKNHVLDTYKLYNWRFSPAMTTLPILFASLSPSNSIASRSPSPFLHIQTLRFCSVKSIQKNPFTSTSRIFYKFPSSIFPAESQDEDEEDDEEDDDDEEAAEEYDEVYAEVSDGDEDSEDELESSVTDEMLNIEESRRQRVEKLRNEVREFGDGIIDVNELASIYTFRIDKFQVSFCFIFFLAESRHNQFYFYFLDMLIFCAKFWRDCRFKLFWEVRLLWYLRLQVAAKLWLLKLLLLLQ